MKKDRFDEDTMVALIGTGLVSFGVAGFWSGIVGICVWLLHWPVWIIAASFVVILVFVMGILLLIIGGGKKDEHI